jgi:hypothetical protein
MRATLEFDLPEDREEHLRAIHALDMAAALWRIGSMLRDKVDRDGATPEQEALLERVLAGYHEILAAEGVDLERLYP